MGGGPTTYIVPVLAQPETLSRMGLRCSAHHSFFYLKNYFFWAWVRMGRTRAGTLSYRDQPNSTGISNFYFGPYLLAADNNAFMLYE